MVIRWIPFNQLTAAAIFVIWIAGISESEDQNDDADDDEEADEYATEDEPHEYDTNKVDTNEVMNRL